MKTKTIWESASRPLFVRSVWLESPHEGRGVQHRHFILDYETQQRMQDSRHKLNSVLSPARSWRRKASLRHSSSCDFSELSDSNQSQLSAVNLLQIGSAKIKLQQPINQQTRQQLKLLKFYRRPSLTKQPRMLKQSSTQYDFKWRMRELQDMYSRHSSLQDLQSTLSMNYLNPEDRLAERVLNWLDLAGKSALVKSADEEETAMWLPENATQSFEQRLPYRQSNQQHCLVHTQQQRHKITHQQQQQRQQHFQQNFSSKKKIRNNYLPHSPQQSKQKRHQRDAVKPITIIFNRDGLPARLNRAARNIDLCALASSAGTTRRLAGSLASARLYQGSNETSAYKPITNLNCAQQQQHKSRGINTAKQRQAAAEVERADLSSNQQSLDSKRQLHIFMPSLPKKSMTSTTPSLLSAAGVSDEATLSLLSQKFNENCKL